MSEDGGLSKDEAGARPSVPALGRAAVGGLVSAAVGAVTERVGSLVPAADLDERDTDYIRETLPGLWALASLYFRADVRGLHHIPREGPVLLVGNHSGGMLAPDLFVFVLAFSTRFGVERRFYQLAHNGVVLGPAGRIVRKYGTLAADPRNAELALSEGAAVLVYPGGDHEVFRPSWQQDRVDFGGRTGFIRLALRMGVPIQPVVSIGSQETALFLTRGERLARLTRVDRMLRLKTLPLMVGLPFGLMPAIFGHIPLPAKITVQVLPKIDLGERYGDDPDVDEINRDVLAAMQDVLTALDHERRLPVIG
ncbi:MAG TPA: lysophospholipid acyltransferase family protein [Solirubrobacteraceae bacterium]|jgi:1-acyl-sn-glycerol-3-phosphate acyltransferase